MLTEGLCFSTQGGVVYQHESPTTTSLSEHLRQRRTHSIHEANKLARKMHEFNLHVSRDPRTEQLLLPIRDGVTIIRKL